MDAASRIDLAGVSLGFRVAGLRFVFIGGFMLTVFAVAARLILGHSSTSIFVKTGYRFLLTAARVIQRGAAQAR